MAELCVWVKEKGEWDQRYVDAEDWKEGFAAKRKEEHEAKAQGRTVFGGSKVQIGIHEEGSNKKKMVSIDEVIRANPREQDGMGDMTGLTFLDEPTMLHNMRFRFAKDFIYTAINKVICAVNPYQWLPVYAEETMAMYRGARLGALPPHVFALAERAFQQMKRGKNQSMVCCGESGSGKTESTKLLMRYLATANAGNTVTGKTDTKVQAQVLQANPVLESFGNASTLMNNNSSRFAKFTKLYFSETSDLVSVDLVTYLLEKSRVVTPPKGERNYHAFYQLFSLPAALDAEQRPILKLTDKKVTDFVFLKDNIQEGRIKDDEFARENYEGMDTLGFDPEIKNSILKVLGGILWLGNVMPFQKEGYAPGTDLKNSSELFGVKPDALVHVLSTKEIVTNGEVILKPRDPADFIANLHSMAKAIYHAVFESLAGFLNEAFPGGKAKQGLWIGVLDVFGFESFENNSFEQLCINFCNEKLQQFFNDYIISSEQEEYEREGIHWETLAVRDRAGCLQLFEKKTPPGIFTLMDSANAQSQDNTRFRTTLLKQHRYNRFLYQPKPIASKNQTVEERKKMDLLDVSFGVKHYAAMVIYDTTSMLVKNADKIDPATVNLFKSSTNAFIASLLAKFDPNARKESVGTAFLSQLSELVKTLKATEPHFVRCINPNNKKMKQEFMLGYVAPQLVNGGLVEAVRMLKLGYPTRYSYNFFFESFSQLLVPDEKVPEGTPDPNDRFYGPKCHIVKSEKPFARYISIRDFCEAVLVAFGLERDQYQCGISKIFFRAGLQELVEDTLTRSRDSDKLQPKTVKKLERWLSYKRQMRMTGSAKFLGRLLLFNKRTHAARAFQVALNTAQAWSDRVNWKENRKNAAEKISKFYLWIIHDRQLLFFRKMTNKVLDGIREERRAEEERMVAQRNRTPAHVLADLAEWLGRVLDQPIISSLIPALKSGEALCDLCTKLDPKIVLDGVHRNKKQVFFARDNLTKAMKGMRGLRCPSNLAFTPDDLVSTVTQNHKKVVLCLQWCASHAFLTKEIPLPKYLQAKLEAGGDLMEEETEGGPPKNASTGASSGAPKSGGSKRPNFDDLDDDEKEKAIAEDAAVAAAGGEGAAAAGGAGGGATEDEDEDDDAEGEEDDEVMDLMVEGQPAFIAPELRNSASAAAAAAPPGAPGSNKALPRGSSMSSISRGSESSSRPSVYSSATERFTNFATGSGIVSVARTKEDMAASLKPEFGKFLFMFKGAKFRQHGEGKVQKRWLKVVPAHGVVQNGKISFDRLFANPGMRLIFTTGRKSSALVFMIGVADLLAIYQGKRDGGKCFPKPSGNPEGDLPLDLNCLTVSSKRRTLGLEAEDEDTAAEWVAALEWCLTVYQLSTGVTGAETQDANDQAASNQPEQVIDPMLEKGSKFDLHGASSNRSIYVRCTPYHIYVLNSEEEKDAPTDADKIEWSSVQEILQGKQTLMFSRMSAKDVEDSKAFSICLSDNRTLDLVAGTEELAFEWYTELSAYLAELQDAYKREQMDRESAIANQLSAAQRALEAERAAKVSEVSELEAAKEKAKSEIEEVNARRAELLSKMESQKSETEQMKVVMAEERDQLIARVTTLQKQNAELSSSYEAELARNSNLLDELQKARQDQAELKELRRTVATWREKRANEAGDVSSALALFHDKFVAFKSLLADPEKPITEGEPGGASSESA
eukprot:gb/GEZN01000230.1/.p1 GENE.gb/GEZN01000230.1/~~gb/GEZN01000230.1/.p1  ORF type:complete len:1688 (+),score=369.98 gb/GEZN01000230.1/:254-5317(+)